MHTNALSSCPCSCPCPCPFRSYADVLPGKNVVLALNNCKAFFTLDEYVSMYAEPLHLDLESESAFPLRRLVNY